MKAIRILNINVVALLALLLTACSDGENMNYAKNGLLVSGTEQVVLQKFVVEDTPASYAVTVKSTRQVESDVQVDLAIDPTLVDAYNAANGTSFYAIPAAAVELQNSTVTIGKGQAISTAATVRVVSTEQFEEGRTYVIPVTIKQAHGDVSEVIEASRTIFLKVSRVLKFAALQNNANASSNFIFADNLRRDLTAWTVEFKFYSDGFGRVGDIKRVLAIEGKGEEEANMFRFGENGSAGGDILQWVLPGGRAFSTTHFQPNRWYLVSCTYDGSTYNMFVDGVLDATTSVSGHVCPFQRFELGMSWGGYRNSQFFSGRIAEVRLWDRALATSEIATGLCSVDPKSAGLVAYWKMNEGEGHILRDATGHGYDMDWTTTSRDDRENGVMVDHDYSQYIQYVTDDNNKCAQ